MFNFGWGSRRGSQASVLRPQFNNSSASLQSVQHNDERGRTLGRPTASGTSSRYVSLDRPEPNYVRGRRASDVSQGPTPVFYNQNPLPIPPQQQRQRSISVSSHRNIQLDPQFLAGLSNRHGSRPPTTGPAFTSRRDPSPARNVIKFYEKHQPYYCFTNFSPDPVIYDDKEYPTSEHLFQAFKFLPHRPGLAEHIRTGSKKSRFAFQEARRFSPEVSPDWLQRNVHTMDQVLYLKFSQNKKLKKQLLGTGNAVLVEDSGNNDDFWGNGADGNGQNQLGLALMRLRDHFNQGGT
ncbi:hypothetical protein FRB94_006816 [Tulasnella sp. JGI-2019a]|nr:hypothetical protein FRB93_010371 [Tulasnella sp. JGI-2019a]KAG9012016.1 hypothetical protein FRB94_006816 [Tulasnella sp. JGI-2019a]